MANPKIVIHDLETNEIIEREMNNFELKEYNKQIDKIKEHQHLQEEKNATRQSALNKLIDLGLTEEEIAVL